MSLVRMEGLEPPRLTAPDPKSGTATNYATCAFLKSGKSKENLGDYIIEDWTRWICLSTILWIEWGEGQNCLNGILKIIRRAWCKLLKILMEIRLLRADRQILSITQSLKSCLVIQILST